MDYIEPARKYISSLIKAGGFTYEQVSVMTGGIPAATIKNFLTGKTAKNPGYQQIICMCLSLSGDLYELVGFEKKTEIEANSTVVMKETYEMRIVDLTESFEQRANDIKELCEMRIADADKHCEKRIADIKSIYNEVLAAHGINVLKI